MRDLLRVEERHQVVVLRVFELAVRRLGPGRPGAAGERQMVVVRGDPDARRRRAELLLAALDVPLDETLVNRVVIDLRERGVAVDDLAQQDQELDQVGVRLLPERLLAAAVQVVEQRRDRVRQRVRLEVVVQRVVAVRRVEADLDVVVRASVIARGCAGPARRSRPSPPGRGRRSSRRLTSPATRATGRRTDTCTRTSCRCPRRRES